MTLIEHLTELRRRVVVSVIAFVVAATAAFVFYAHILSFLKEPYCRVSPNCSLYITSPLDALSLRVEIAAYGGLILASPVILWELWRFVTPGLHAHEKRYAIPFVASAISFFSAGGAVAYVIFPRPGLACFDRGAEPAPDLRS